MKGALKYSQDDKPRARVDWRRRFKVSFVCRRSWSHRKLGKES